MFTGWAVSFEYEVRDIWCSTIRAISCNVYSGGIASGSEIPQLQFKKYLSPTQLTFPKQTGWCWISQMLYYVMLFQSVLDPIVHDYSQVQNCMHKQLQQQFTDCELNQPIVSTISCSLLIWKEPGRWLPLQLASCGQLRLLVQFCTLKHGMCKRGALSRNFIPWAPNILVVTLLALGPATWISKEETASRKMQMQWWRSNLMECYTSWRNKAVCIWAEKGGRGVRY